MTGIIVGGWSAGAIPFDGWSFEEDTGPAIVHETIDITVEHTLDLDRQVGASRSLDRQVAASRTVDHVVAKAVTICPRTVEATKEVLREVED